MIEQFDFKNKKLMIQITQSLTSDLAGRIAGLFAGGPVGILPAQQSLDFPAPEPETPPAEEDQTSLELTAAPAD